jgi:tRNA A37 threonylcarbamoyladenosine synthetase subunit TsaC/SUA5/YrdC
LITTSIHDEDELIEYPSDPSLILDMMDGVADLMIDGGYGNNIASTVVDLRGGEAEVLRQGLGDIDQYL